MMIRLWRKLGLVFLALVMIVILLPTNMRVSATHPTRKVVAGNAIAARYHYTTPYYDVVILTSPARIEQLSLDPSGKSHYMGVIDNFARKGSSIYASYTSFSNIEEHAFDAGRPTQAIVSPNALQLLGIPVGPNGLIADWTFTFAPTNFDVSLLWHVTRPQSNLWEAGWKLDGTARHIGDATNVDLPSGDRGCYVNTATCHASFNPNAHILWWENDPRYAHTLVTAFASGSADRGDNYYLETSPTAGRPVTWAAWQTIWANGGTNVAPGDIRAGRWRIGASGNAPDTTYANALSNEVNGGPATVPSPWPAAGPSNLADAVTWGKHLPPPATGGPTSVQVTHTPDGSWVLSDGVVLAAFVPTGAGQFKARLFNTTGQNWQFLAGGGPTQMFNTVADGGNGSLLVSSQGVGLDGTVRITTHEQWTIREQPSRIHVESTDDHVQGAPASQPMHTLLAYPNAASKYQTTSYDMLTSPHLRPQADLVIGQSVMRSPALTVQVGSSYVALVPDLLVMRQPGNYGAEPSDTYFAPTMDFDVADHLVDAPLLGFGWRNTQHVYGYFWRDLGDTAPTTSVHIAYDVLMRTQAPPQSVVSDSQAFLWNQVGHRYFTQSRLPQTQPADSAFNEGWSYWRHGH